ncbi:MAG: discoidin domain-containing protein [Pyrinomonadaceae bacterium]|nr:discoidin domain-containing protein [Pyrinomonadaceae bacterium]
MNKIHSFALFFFLLSLCASLTFAQNSTNINLSGTWQFALDKEDKGITEKWFDQNLTDKIQLPGILQSQGFGNEISKDTPWVLSLYDKNWSLREDYKAYTNPGKVKVPFLSQPPKHYLGAAWYQKDIEIPANWQNKRVVLFLERPKWESTVWIDGKKIGSNLSLVAPHEYDLSVLPTGKHRITIRVDNRMLMNYRPDAHSVSDSLGMSWNGIVGKIELRATSQVWIEDAQIYPNFQDKTATLKIKIGNADNQGFLGIIKTSNFTSSPLDIAEKGSSYEFKLKYPNAKTWDEFQPNLIKEKIRLYEFAPDEPSFDDSKEISFGFAQISTDKNEFKLNGRTIYLRGTHHGGDFPLTGYPPTDVEYWRKIFKINKNWGINHIRFHSFCPPEAAFQAADEIGIYLQPEPAMWNTVSPGTPMEEMLYKETEAMIKAYGNHPSYLMLSPSNEPKGNWKESFDKWMAVYRVKDPRRIYDNGTGHTEPSVPDLEKGTDFLVMQRIGQKMLRGNTAWFGKDYGKSLEGIEIPVASHELGQWIAYPDFNVIKKFTGYMRPGNYEIFRDSLAKKGMLARNKDFAYASGKFQLNCYKEEIEANLRTPKMYGFQLLDLHDYLGQGTALVGILDAFWEEKGYATAKEFRRFNSETVSLARLYKRTFKSDEKFEVEVETAHFGEKPLENVVPYWKIVDVKGNTVANGEFPAKTINISKNIALGKVVVDLSKVYPRIKTMSERRRNGIIEIVMKVPPESPHQLKLIVGIKNTEFENDWNFWVYPAKVEETESKSIVITHSWDEAEAKLKQGAKVLYMPRKADLDWTSPPLDTVPVFWNRLMNPAWSRMLGMWIDKKHPALAEFPTEEFNDWQWTELIKGARAINLDKLPKNLQPIVQPVDDWNRNYKLGMIFEAKVGKGKLMVSSADLENDLDNRIVARSLRKSILDYMLSAKFNPQVSITPANFREILFPTRIMLRLGTLTDVKEQVSAFDGDPNTFWLAGDQKKDRQNQEFSVYFPKSVLFSGLVIMPRQNHRDHEGDIREYSVSISDDGKTWTEIKRGDLVSTFDPQKILFGKTVSAKYLRLTSLSGFGTDKTTAIAELAIIYEGAKLPEDATDLEYKRIKSASSDIDEGVNADDKKPKPTPTKKP